ncbi:copper homeostasis protein cutC homolog [Neodiprion fabricii]|uniref:copper homeostasis protein cutC homolog n=1 Tax=Neodiprion fabricii TaxID=2872261 RepID=UPI001ED937C1|nr:copper homeostasis protein cutC homolog [Neodiprion fabricii]
MEICIDSIESAQNAVNGGAMRLEVCSGLSDGGLTPTPGFVKSLRKMTSIPLYAMLRIRGGNFVYTPEEVEAMLYDLELLKTVGVDGFVFGALTSDGKIDGETNKKIIDTASPLPVTFHRAFDEVNYNPQLAARMISQLGFKRILTSGQKNSAEEGLDLIRSLASAASPGFTIVPGAGITPDNIKKIKDESMCSEFHASARKPKTEFGTKHKMGSEKDSNSFMVADEETVRQLVLVVNRA